MVQRKVQEPTEGGLPSSFPYMRARNVSGYILAMMVVPFMG